MKTYKKFICKPHDTRDGLKKQCASSLFSSEIEKARSRVKKKGPKFYNNCMSIALMKLGKKTLFIIYKS